MKETFLVATLQLIWSRRQLLLRTIGITLRQRYAGTVLGGLWLLVGPLLLLAVYSILYLKVLGVRVAEMTPQAYILYIFAGLLPFMFFCQGLVQGSTSLSANRELLLNSVFPPELVPMREVGAALFALVPGMVIVCLATLVMGRASMSLLLVPVVLILMFMFLTALTWILSLANLVLKDIEQILTYATILLLAASPIAYTPDMVPDAFRVFIYLNPLAYFLVTLQHCIVLGSIPPWPILFGTFFVGIGALVLGAWVFRRAKFVFFDYA